MRFSEFSLGSQSVGQLLDVNIVEWIFATDFGENLDVALIFGLALLQTSEGREKYHLVGVGFGNELLERLGRLVSGHCSIT